MEHNITRCQVCNKPATWGLLLDQFSPPGGEPSTSSDAIAFCSSHVGTPVVIDPHLGTINIFTH